jgi:8-oxo-dGTP diphosphatase
VRIVLGDEDGRLLMLKRAADDDAHPGLWEMPGGGIDAGETAAQAAARELREEVGIDVPAEDLADWGWFERGAGGRKRRTAFFAADCAHADCHPSLSHEHDDWRWVAGPSELEPEPLTPSARWAVARHPWRDRDRDGHRSA